jgi:hypothetical protein
MPLTVKSVLLNKGRELVDAALTGRARYAPYAFKLGSSVNFAPLKTDLDVTGAVVYTGGPELIQARATSQGSVRYTMTLPEGVGPFDFGNIVLFANTSDGQELPLIKITLPFLVRKEPASTTLDPDNPYPRPGDRMVITAYILQNVEDSDGLPSISVTITAPASASLPIFDDESTVPPPVSHPWNQFVIQKHTLTGTPVLATKDGDDIHWGTPMRQNLRDPNFGTVHGGYAGEGYLAPQHTWSWGHKYETPNVKFSGQVGGYGYTTIVVPAPIVIGGQSY